MSGSTGGRFQSGREVFEEYIPNYTSPLGARERSILEAEALAANFVNELLKDFSRHLSIASRENPEQG